MPSRSQLLLPLLVALAVAGVAVLLLVTEHGIGITPDSVAYVRAARSLHDQLELNAIGPDGGSTPFTQWPPLFPAVLALLAMLGLDLIAALRWLNAILFGASILLVGVIVRRYARACFWLPLAASFLTMVSIVMYRIYSQALSEPLFILLVTLGLFLLALHTERPSLRLLIGASLAVSLGVLTRYAGLAYVLAGTLWLMLPGRRTRFGKVRDAAVFTTICLVPIALWVVRNLALSGSASNRTLAFHPLTPGFLRTAATALTRWTLPWLAVIFLLAALIVWRGTARARLAAIVRNIRPGSIHLFGLSILTYGVTIVASSSLAGSGLGPDERILLPVYVSSLILTICFCGATICDARNSRFFRTLTIVLLIFLAGSYCVRSARWIEEHRHDGQGYMMRAWRDSPTIAAIKSLPPGTLIYTQGQDVAYIIGGLDTARIPLKASPNSGLENMQYQAELERMLARLRDENGVLVYFEEIRWPYYPSREELAGGLPLDLVNRTEDGWIYRARIPR